MFAPSRGLDVEDIPTAEELLRHARSLASTARHQELDPAHVLLAIAHRENPLSRELMADVGATPEDVAEDLDRRLRPGEKIPGDRIPTGRAMVYVGELATGGGGAHRVTVEALVLAIWNAPGATAPYTERGFRLVAATLRDSRGAATPVDRLRLSARRLRLAVRSRLTHVLDTKIGRLGAALYKGFQQLQRSLSRSFALLVNGGATLLLAPGLTMREGSRIIIARLGGSRRRERGFVQSLGADYYLDPVSRPGRVGLVLLLPHALALAIGTALMLQPLTDTHTVGTTALPALTSRGTAFFSTDETALLVDLVSRNPINSWFALACLVVAFPTHTTVRRTHAQFAAAGAVGRAIAAAFRPLVLLSVVLLPIERLLSHAGLNAVVGLGLLTWLGGMLAASQIVEHLIL